MQLKKNIREWGISHSNSWEIHTWLSQRHFSAENKRVRAPTEVVVEEKREKGRSYLKTDGE